MLISIIAIIFGVQLLLFLLLLLLLRLLWLFIIIIFRVVFFIGIDSLIIAGEGRGAGWGDDDGYSVIREIYHLCCSGAWLSWKG